VGDHQGKGLRMRGPDVEEVDVEAVDLGDELGVGVDPRFGSPPVVAVGPVVTELACVGERSALGPVVHRLRFGPPGPLQSVPKIGEFGVSNFDAERSDLIGHSVTVGPRAGPCMRPHLHLADNDG
jgi:hypothetical protein